MIQAFYYFVSDLYPDLSPADYDNAGRIEQGQEPITVPDNVSEQQKQEWREELEKVWQHMVTSFLNRFFHTVIMGLVEKWRICSLWDS